jgi:hypothetical protein
MNALSGYIELPMGEEVLAFKFGTNAWALFCEMKGIEFGEIGNSGVFGTIKDGEVIKSPDILSLRDLYYCAHVAAMRSKGLQPKVNIDAFGDLMDETSGAVLDLQKAMLTAKMMGFTLNELAEEGKKKANP